MSDTDPRIKHLPGSLSDDIPALITQAIDLKIDLIIPGPEAPLIAGIKTQCQNAGIRCFGPSELAARMEGSKAFAKEFMIKHSIPTARYQSFKDTQFEEALAFLQTMPEKLVIKASGIAAGKGVIISEAREESEKALKNVMIGKEFGSAGDEVVIEEFLEGEELSILSFCDGYTIRSLPPAQDHKQIYDGDKGPMTGGMGCYSPTRIATPEIIDEIHRRILQPTIDCMRHDGIPFVGILFTGLMITADGPKVLEYNVRFGDPETQTLLPLLNSKTDLIRILLACTDGYLDAMTLQIESKFSATVVAVAGGYPGTHAKGEEISVPDTPANTRIFHAGTSLKDGKLRTNGGRVLAVNAIGSSLEEALKAAYSVVKSISFPNIFFRQDIGHRNLTPSGSQVTKSGVPGEQIPLTYAQSGVSITAGNDLVKGITSLVAKTARPGTNASIGGFGGVFSLPAAGYTHPNTTLIGAIDGIGTKLFLAQQLSIHNTIGIDLVAMNVNDLVVQGAEPLFFLDCYTCSKLDVQVANAFVEGVASGCRTANCALIGGETAEMPGLFSKGIPAKTKERLKITDDGSVYDGVGAAVGAIAHGKPILPLKEIMQQGDIIIGLASDGPHSNGFSLIRMIIEQSETDLVIKAPWNESQTIGQALLTPTRIYVRSVLSALDKFNTNDNTNFQFHSSSSLEDDSASSPSKIIIKGLAHITGGGLTENIPRALPKHLAAHIDASRWPLPAVFRWLRKTAATEPNTVADDTPVGSGGITDSEMARVWNCGIGMVLVIERGSEESVKRFFEEQGEKVFIIGELVERRNSDEERCVVNGMERFWR